jgi:E3 ubiquitin-protein ligase RNF14
MDMDTTTTDERNEELSTISAIFPELVVDSENACSASIDLPVTPAKPISVAFPPIVQTGDRFQGGDAPPEETHVLTHLPPIRLQITLPVGYPTEVPPIFHVATNPQWIPEDIIHQLHQDGARLWEEIGHDQVVYAYIDHLQQAAENAFGIVAGKTGNVDDETRLEMSPEHKIAILDYDIKIKKATFEKETFDCGICLGRQTNSKSREILLTSVRSKERQRMPSNVRLWSRLLPQVPTRFLQQRD